MAHTPGPWFVSADRIASDHGDIAAVHYQSFREQKGWHCADDARLIAAAPDLLAALKLLRNPGGDGKWPCYCNDPHYYGGQCENCIATAAIDKAEGGAK